MVTAISTIIGIIRIMMDMVVNATIVYTVKIEVVVDLKNSGILFYFKIRIMGACSSKKMSGD